MNPGATIRSRASNTRARIRLRHTANLRNATVDNRDVAREAWCALAVVDGSALEEEIVTGHRTFVNGWENEA